MPYELEQCDDAGHCSVVQGGHETEECILDHQLEHCAAPRAAPVDLHQPAPWGTIAIVISEARVDAVRIGDRCERVLGRAQHPGEGYVHTDRPGEPQGCESREEHGADLKGDGAEVRVADAWAVDLLVRNWHDGQRVPVVARYLDELQRDEKDGPKRDPEAHIGDGMDLQKLEEEEHHAVSPPTEAVAPAEAAAARDQGAEVGELGKGEHVPGRLREAAVAARLRITAAPGTATSARQALAARHGVVEARQENGLDAQLTRSREEAFDEHVVVFGDDIAVLSRRGAALASDNLQCGECQAVRGKRNLELAPTCRAQHLLRRDHDAELPHARGDLPEVARREHARLPYQVVLVQLRAIVVSHNREVVRIVERVAVCDVDHDVALVDDAAVQVLQLVVRDLLAHHLQRKSVVGGLARDLVIPIRWMVGREHVAEVAAQLALNLRHLFARGLPFSLLHGQDQSDVSLAEPLGRASVRFLRHQRVHDALQVRGLLLVRCDNHDVVHVVPVLPNVVFCSLLIPSSIPILIFCSSVLRRPMQGPDANVERVKGQAEGEQPQCGKRRVIPPRLSKD
mmetsp:Transcript_175373/g.562575  ORF Transcript_175373/g.562575 Transcript_175373/m.562575 type:complete len:569 (+) Transcript_175373:275-1981(+)